MNFSIFTCCRNLICHLENLNNFHFRSGNGTRALASGVRVARLVTSLGDVLIFDLEESYYSY
jgi:hypothetical protein